MKTIHASTLIGTLLVASIGPHARAGTWKTCGSAPLKWTNPTIGMVVRASDFEPGTDFADALFWCANTWSNTASNVSYNISWIPEESEPPIGDENGVSEIYFVDNLDAPAATYTWKVEQTCTITEADVVINSSHNWTTSTDASDLIPYAGQLRPFQTMMLHELGHAQGLAHDGDTYSIMGEDYRHIHYNAGIATAYVGEVDVALSAAVYGFKPAWLQDVGISHWKRTGYSGGSEGYSLYNRTQMHAVSGPPLHDTFEVVKKYEVTIGQEVEIEVLLENFGASDQLMNIGYYLSTNDNITTEDTLLATQGVYVSPDKPEVVTSPALTIPSDLPSKTDFWIGAIIDYNDFLAETHEWNNRTQIAIATAPLPKDLVAVDIFGPVNVTVGETHQVNTIIENHGDEGGGLFTYEIRLSTDQVVSFTDPLIYSEKTSTLGLDVGVYTIPNVPPGTYFWALRVVTDESDGDPTNNDVIGNYVTVNPAPPNLIAVSATGPQTAVTGQNVTLDCVIANVGQPVGGPIEYQVVLSSDTTISATDLVIKSGSIAGPGSFSARGPIPNVKSGTYYFGLIVTSPASETNTSDNVVLGNAVTISGLFGGGPKKGT